MKQNPTIQDLLPKGKNEKRVTKEARTFSSFQKQTLPWENITRKIGNIFGFTLLGSDAATSANYTTIPFIAPYPIEIGKVQVTYTTASTSGTLQIERLDNGDAPGAGDSILASTIDLSGTANTVISRSRYELTSSRILKENQRLALVDGGTLTNLTDLVVSIYYKAANRGDYRY